jgi:hypothetical protein
MRSLTSFLGVLQETLSRSTTRKTLRKLSYLDTFVSQSTKVSPGSVSMQYAVNIEAMLLFLDGVISTVVYFLANVAPCPVLVACDPWKQ